MDYKKEVRAGNSDKDGYIKFKDYGVYFAKDTRMIWQVEQEPNIEDFYVYVYNNQPDTPFHNTEISTTAGYHSLFYVHQDYEKLIKELSL